MIAGRKSRINPSQARVAIFGDLYARDNEVFNKDLIHFTEGHGGEDVTTPYSSYVLRPAGFVTITRRR